MAQNHHHAIDGDGIGTRNGLANCLALVDTIAQRVLASGLFYGNAIQVGERFRLGVIEARLPARF
jgi:hypothetical protein